jgi:hypothetical protein
VDLFEQADGEDDITVGRDLVQDVFVLEGGIGAGAVAPEEDRQFSLGAKGRQVAGAKVRRSLARQRYHSR